VWRDKEGRITGYDPEQMGKDGPWTPVFAAYRRFLDTLLYDKYSAARRLVRTLDANHAVSFRMTEAGDPTFTDRFTIPFDFAYLAGAVDTLEPEAYGRIGDWERVKPGIFLATYARWANAALPMFWAEAGVHAWDMARMESSPKMLDYEAEFYERIYRMLDMSGADGIFFWWYPGGYRTGENSDYGVINPDGLDRPVSKVIRSHAQALLDGPDLPPVDMWLEFDRDKFTNGITGVYDEVKDAYWKALDEGKTPGLKTAGTGTSSADCPLLAVGNKECNGSNPPKYLDAFFDVVEVKDAAGEWVPVSKDGEVAVGSSETLMARLTVTNLGEAGLLASKDAPAGVGAVYVLTEGKNAMRTSLPQGLRRFQSETFEMALTPDPITQPLDVTLTFEAAKRTLFGPKFTIHLKP
jgi:hypothetical protein